MSINTDQAADSAVITVVLDPRVAYQGFGPDDGRWPSSPGISARKR